MKKILSFLAVASMALSANAERSHYQDRNYADWGKLKLVGNQLSDKDGNPVQLKGWSTYSLNFVGGCIGGGQWKLMKEYGANIVRLAMPIDDPKEGGSYLAKPDYFKHLIKLSIEETKKLDMYCIVDWHITPDSLLSGDPNDYVNESKDFFGEISKYCADNGYDHVLYEICNEPTCGWVNVKSYAKDVIPVITANQPDAIVIVGTDQWSQRIMEPVFNPIDSTYKKNVMYSFHYDACSHYSLLGDFRNAQKKIPVFVSEWSAVKFNGEGPFCASNSDELLYSCDNIDVAPQVVSWCLWNWGKKDEASSFFTDSCAPGNLSKYMDESGRKYSDYVIELMSGPQPHPCYTPPDGPWSTINTIPSTEASLWRWDYYNKGGEGIAYHDLNGGAYEKDENGAVIGYSRNGEEVDVFSLAKQMQWLNDACPWSTVEDGKVVAWDKSINTTWQDENGNPTYKSLNGGRTYVGPDGPIRPDEGVDLLYASLNGTAHEGELYSNLGWVEEGEWINYTVTVNKPGYYKIKGIIGAEYREYTKNGEISIIQDGKNILRDTSALDDETTITSFGFPRTTKCDDPKADIDFTPWDCWTVSDAKSGRNKEVLCYFKEAGEQEITIVFNGNAGGVGPLIFDFYKELNPEDPYVCCGGGIQTAVNTISSTESSLWHWDYYDNGGEGVAYHDLNSGAYEKDDDGVVIGYSNTGEEVDVFSLAKEMKWLDESCPWSTVVDGNVVAFDSIIATAWRDSSGKPTYRSLNAGRMYDGPDGSVRPDEGVDLCRALMNGTSHEGEGYTNLGWVEEGEWINYTVRVEKPGYYKIRGIVSAEYRGANRNGEISIASNGINLLRIPEHISDFDAITSFGFPITEKCDDRKVDASTEPWYCWTIADAKSGREKEVLCEFSEAGEQMINISFSGNAGGVGPLIFDWYSEVPEDPFICCDDPGDVNDVDAVKFSINPNPTSGEFTITLAENIEANVEIVNMAGQVVVSQKIVGSATINKILPAGVYTVVVKSNGAVSTQKLVVK